MIDLRNGRKLIQCLEDLPNVPSDAKVIYADAETDGLHPYKGNVPCGWAFSWDKEPTVWYLPVRHKSKHWNIKGYKPFLRDLFKGRIWDNANVKFDAHMLAEHEGIENWSGLIDVQNRAKTLDSERFSFALKPLHKDWCGGSSETQDRVLAYLHGIGQTKATYDYSYCPADILGVYACDDVRKVRDLERYMHDKCPSRKLWANEDRLTPVLWDAERRGLKIDVLETKKEQLKTSVRILHAAQTIHELTGLVPAKSNKFMSELLLGHYCLPIVKWTKDKKTKQNKGPSFDKAAMAIYRTLPDVVAYPDRKKVVNLLSRWSTDSTYLGLFLNSFLAKHIDGIIHPLYRQTIRTGRMASSDPNSQQFDLRAKILILPREGFALSLWDASQIEFRVGTHFMNDPDLIAAYRHNPKTDYHQWVADMIGCARKPAKNVNFAMLFGAGKAKILSMLEGILGSEFDAEALGPVLYKQACEVRALAVFEKYHETIPVKRTAYRAANICKRTGRIKSPSGRERHLPARAAHNAFNTLTQGYAMDIIKERTCDLSPRYNREVRELGVHFVLNVHDCDGFEVPLGYRKEWEALARPILEDTSPLRVPLLWDHEWEEQTWGGDK